MSRGFPSMTALLGLLAVAGYQNRDKLAEMLGGKQGAPGSPQQQGGLGGLLGQLSSGLGSAGVGGLLSGGLGELVERFKENGHADTVNSMGWYRSKQTNRAVASRASNWPGCAGDADKTNGFVARRNSRPAVTGAS